MKVELYCVKDEKAGRFTGIMTFPSEVIALRAIATAVNDPKKDQLVSLYPEDCSVYMLGTFDDESGELVSCNKFVRNCVELVRGGDK